MSLRDAARALVDKLTRVHASREYETVWYTAHLHNGPYQGPTYIDELDALRAALAADAAHGGWEEALEAAATLVENADDGAPLQCMADAIRELSRPAAHGGERARCDHGCDAFQKAHAAAPSPLENEEADRLVAPLFADDGKRSPIRAPSPEAGPERCIVCGKYEDMAVHRLPWKIDHHPFAAPGRSGGKP